MIGKLGGGGGKVLLVLGGDLLKTRILKEKAKLARDIKINNGEFPSCSNN